MSDRFGNGERKDGGYGSAGGPPHPNQGQPHGRPPTGPPPSYPDQGRPRPPQGPAQPPGPPPQRPAPSGGSGRPRRPALWIGGGVITVVAVGVAVFFAIRAGSPDIQTADGAVSNAEDFLADVRSDWRAQLPSENVNIGDDPSCYYVVDDDSDEVTGVIACGGVRRLNSGDGEVWDTYNYDVTKNAEGELVASGAEQTETSVERPGGALMGATGDEASDDVDDLAAPELPRADEGVLRSGDQLDVSKLELEDVKRPEDAGTIITPGGTVTVASVASAPYLPGEPAEQAAEGEAFRVVTYTLDANDEADGNVAPTLLIDAGGQQREIGGDDVYLDEDDKTSVAVSVPEDEPASLVVASAGHEQRIDLATGKREPDPMTDAYYRSVTEQDIGKAQNYPFQRVKTDNGRERLAYSLDIQSARVSPYTGTGGLGYAQKGKVWLQVEFTGEFRDPDYEFDLERTDFNWTARVGGEKIDATKVRAGEWDEDHVVLYAVPADVTDVEITAKPTLVVTSWSTPRRTVQFGPTTAKVSFPK